MHSEGILAGELKHGPLALIDKDMPVIMIIMKDACYTKCQNALQQVTARSVGPRTFTAKTERQDRETGERDRAERQDRETGQRDSHREGDPSTHTRVDLHTHTWHACTHIHTNTQTDTHMNPHLLLSTL